jgi:hypothetical protein
MSAELVSLPGRKKRFTDFAEPTETALDGFKVCINDLLGNEIEIIGYRLTPTKYIRNLPSRCLTLHIIFDGERRVVFSGSEVLIRQMERYKEHLPFMATIRKVDKYYTLS